MLCISSSGVLGRYVPLAPAPAIWWRCALAALLMWAYLRYRGTPLGLRGPARGRVVLAGVLMAVHWVLYFYALQLSSVAVGMLAVFTYPAFTTVLEPPLMRQPFRPYHLALSALVLFGVYLLAPPGFSLADEASLGLLCGVVSALFYALRNLLVKPQLAVLDGSALMFWQVVVAVVVLLPFVGVGGLALPPPAAWPFLLGLAVVTTAVGHTLFLRSFRRFSVSSASLLSCVQPVYGILLGVVFYREVPSAVQVAGGAAILAAVVIEARRLVARPTAD